MGKDHTKGPPTSEGERTPPTVIAPDSLISLPPRTTHARCSFLPKTTSRHTKSAFNPGDTVHPKKNKKDVALDRSENGAHVGIKGKGDLAESQRRLCTALRARQARCRLLSTEGIDALFDDIMTCRRSSCAPASRDCAHRPAPL